MLPIVEVRHAFVPGPRQNDSGATFAGSATTRAVASARDRWATLTAAFPETASTTVLRGVLAWDPVDVHLLIAAATWFREHPNVDDAWTPRMVPVPGLHAKWLDQHRRRGLIVDLAGIDNITLLERPAQLHLTYLDPTWLDSGGRRWDVLTDGDTATLPYRPRAVIVTENRDTAFFFPRLPQAVAAHGDGNAAVRRLAETLPDTPIIYWGDIDAAGLEIVDSLRSRRSRTHPQGVDVTTILMDSSTYDQYRQFGATTDTKGVPLKPPERRPVPDLTTTERALYERLTDPTWDGPRRIEQERIPLPVAHAAVEAALTQPPQHGEQTR